MIGHLRNYLSDDLALLVTFEHLVWGERVVREKIQVADALLLRRRPMPRRERDLSLPDPTPQMIARLIGGNREEPRPKTAGRVEARGRLMHLYESLLDDILRRSRVLDEPGDELVQLRAVPTDKGRECDVVTGQERREQFAV